MGPKGSQPPPPASPSSLPRSKAVMAARCPPALRPPSTNLGTTGPWDRPATLDLRPNMAMGIHLVEEHLPKKTETNILDGFVQLMQPCNTPMLRWFPHYNWPFWGYHHGYAQPQMAPRNCCRSTVKPAHCDPFLHPPETNVASWSYRFYLAKFSSNGDHCWCNHCWWWSSIIILKNNCEFSWVYLDHSPLITILIIKCYHHL